MPEIEITTHWGMPTFDREAATLARIIAGNGSGFTWGEAEHWVKRLTDAYNADTDPADV